MNGYVPIYSKMINVFEESQAEKEQNVIDMIQRGYSYNQIMKECHVSPSTISRIRKTWFGSTEADSLKNASQRSKESKALELFKEGKKPLDVAIELDLTADSVLVIQKKFYDLIGLDEFNRAYEQVDGNMAPFLELFNLMTMLGMNPRQVADAVKYGIALPNLLTVHSNLSKEIQFLEFQKNNLNSQLNSISNGLKDYKRTLDTYTKLCVQKKNDLLILDYEIKNMQNLIQNFDNNEGYQRIKKESIEQTKSIIKDNHLLASVTVSCTIEALRRYPHNQELFYDLSGSQGYPTSHQQALIHSHATQLLHLSEQVQGELTERIIGLVLSNIKLLPKKT